MKDSWFFDEIAAQRERLFLWAPVLFAAGIGGYFSLGQEPAWWPAVVLAVAAAGAAFALKGRPVLPVLFLLALIAASGFMAAQIHTRIAYTPLLEKKLGPVEVTGTIETAEDLDGGKGQRILLYDLSIENLPPEKTPVEIRLSDRKSEGFAPGQRVKLLAQMNPPSPPVAPDAFDFQRYMYFQQIGAVGFIYKKIALISERQDAGRNYIEELRNVIAARITKVVGAKQAPMAVAFTTGQRTAITDDDNTAMRNAGLFHLISISGLHIGIFSAIVFFMARLAMACIPGLALKYPIKKYAAVPGFAAAAFYTALAGASIPTQRTLIMIGVAYLAIILDRSPLSLRLIAFAALVVLLMSPDSLVSASFQMSFAAVAALIVFYEWARPFLAEWNRRPGVIRKIGLYIAGVCITTIIATIATAPFSLFQFQNLAIYGLIGNALAVPLTSFVIMPAIVLSLALMPVHLEFIPLHVLDWGMATLLDIARSVSALPFAALHISAWPLDALVVIVCGMVFLGLWNGRLRFLGLLPIMVAVFMVAHFRQPDILISPEFDLAGYRAADGGLYVSGLRKNKFAIQSWERMDGLQPGTAKSWPREGREGDIACDEKACRLELRGHRVSFLREPGAIAEECGWAELIVSFGVLDRKTCDGAVVLHKFDGMDNGAYAAWLDSSGIRIKTARDVRGVRPWSQ